MHVARLGVVASGDVHYHSRERHRLHDVLVAIRHRTTLDGSHGARRPNSEFSLRPLEEVTVLFRDCPDAVATTMAIVVATASGQSRNSTVTSSSGRRENSLFGRRAPCEPSSVVRWRIATSTSCSR